MMFALNIESVVDETIILNHEQHVQFLKHFLTPDVVVQSTRFSSNR